MGIAAWKTLRESGGLLWAVGFFIVLAVGDAVGETAAVKLSNAPSLPDGSVGSAELTDEELADLRKLREVLRALVIDARETDDSRRDVVLALNRIHEALNDWGKKGQLEWYTDLLLKGMEGKVQGALAAGAQCAAKARNYHLGGVHSFWRDMDAACQGGKRRLSSETKAPREKLAKCVQLLEKKPSLTPKLKPYRLPTVKMDISPYIKPYPEPKPGK